jgi:methylase of polypeptide subunit release factors
MPRAPGLDLRAVAEVRGALVRAGYDEAGLRGLLGDVDPALAPAEQEALWLWRARGAEPLAVLVRLFLLQRPVLRSAAKRALGPGGLAAAEALALVRGSGRKLAAAVHLSLHAGLLVASDREPAAGEPARDHVLGPTAATIALDRLTIRRPVRRALDLGTGTGYLALRLAAHAPAVVATDVAPRALARARLNAALNEVSVPGRLELLRSDRFAALGRRRFDLVTANLPFVISPERRFTYRDAGEPADGFFASVVRRVGRHLEEGGYAQILAQWAHVEGEEEDERVAPWIVAAGCDALVLRLEREPVDRYAARWSAGPVSAGPGSIDGRERQRRLAAWMRAYERAGIREISTGLWTLRRRATGRHFMAFEDAAVPTRPCGDEILARFTAADA